MIKYFVLDLSQIWMQLVPEYCRFVALPRITSMTRTCVNLCIYPT